MLNQALFFTVTDGFWEAMNLAGELFGFEALFGIVADALGPRSSPARCTAAQIVDRLFSAVNKHRLDSPTIDDSAVVLARFGSN